VGLPPPLETPGVPAVRPWLRPGSCQEAASRVREAFALVAADASAAIEVGADSDPGGGVARRSDRAAATEASRECLQGEVALGVPLGVPVLTLSAV